MIKNAQTSAEIKWSASGIILTCAIVVGAIRAWMQYKGTTKTSFQQWAIAYGALFFIIAIVAEFSAAAAASFAMAVTVADFLQNGEALTTGIANTVSGTENNTTTTTQKTLTTGSEKLGDTPQNISTGAFDVNPANFDLNVSKNG